MKKIYEFETVPSGTVRPVAYLSPVIDNNGEIYSVFLLRRYVQGLGTYNYQPCVAFETISFNGEWSNTPFSNTLTKIDGREIAYSGSSVYWDKSGYINSGYKTFHDFNSEKKLAIKCIAGFTNGSQSFSFTSPTDSTGYTYSFYLPVIDYDSGDFWEKIEKIPKPKLAFEVDTSTEGGGDGEYDDNSSDTIGLPDLDFLNANSISNTKFFSCYKMTPGQLSVLSEHLWTDWRNITEAIGNSILKPLDFVISLNMLPVNVESTPKVIKMGWFTLNSVVQGGLINQQYVRVNCGSLTVKKKWGGAIDYQTDVSLFLPFIGEVTLNANEVMGATLTVIYTVDIMSGNCIASVQVVKDGLNAILYQYNGNVASNFSITSLDYSNVMSGALQLAVAVGTGVGKGVGAFTSAVSSASNLLSGADVRRAGNLSATSGFMGIKKPYLILSRPIQSLPSEYNTFRGYVSNITLALSECSGFTKVAEIHLENIPATEAEISEIESLLKSGVIIK